MRERAADLGARLRQEDGIGRTAELFTEYLRTSRARQASSWPGSVRRPVYRRR